MMTHEEVKQEVHLWSKKIGVKPLEVHIRQMKLKWASCSSRGRITLNSDILAEPKKFHDEVIVHELLHLKYPNHGKMFKALLKSYLGGSYGQ
jgi:predicted metal-dependent hydrolase